MAIHLQSRRIPNTLEMESFYPKMLIAENQNKGDDDMYIVHEYLFHFSRPAVLRSLDEVISSKRCNDQDHLMQIADFGTADGRGSLSIINEIIATVRSRCGEKHPIVVYYNDHVMNDFNILGRVLKGNTHVQGLLYDKNVYAAMIPRTMYDQCLPEKYLDLSISSGAVHYLSTKVCNILDGVVVEEADHKEKGLMAEQAKLDWRSFVIARGRELKSGGYLIVQSAVRTKEGLIYSPVSGGLKMIGALVREMKNDGLITEQEYVETNLNVYYRDEEELLEPFINPVPEVEELNLEVVSIRICKRNLDHEVYHIVNKDTEAKKKYAERIVCSIKPWMHHVVYGGLLNSRPEEEKQEILNNFWDRLYKYAYANSEYKPYLVFFEIIIKRLKTVD